MSVKIYSTTTCTSCHVLTQWLDQQKVAYDKVNTDEDAAAMVEFMTLNDGMISVPFTVIKDDSGEITAKISGYDQKQLKAALNLG